MSPCSLFHEPLFSVSWAPVLCWMSPYYLFDEPLVSILWVPVLYFMSPCSLFHESLFMFVEPLPLTLLWEMNNWILSDNLKICLAIRRTRNYSYPSSGSRLRPIPSHLYENESLNLVSWACGYIELIDSKLFSTSIVILISVHPYKTTHSDSKTIFSRQNKVSVRGG